MINLIPPAAQKSVKRQYLIRLATVWLILAGFACMIVGILNVPVYVLVRSQLDAFSNEYAQASVESASFDASTKEIVRANETAQLLSGSKHKVSFSHIISELERESGSEVRIKEYALSQEKGTLTALTIKGTANSRLALTNFQERIEAHELFESAVLPLSNLARDRDIPFEIAITPEKPQE